MDYVFSDIVGYTLFLEKKFRFFLRVYVDWNAPITYQFIDPLIGVQRSWWTTICYRDVSYSNEKLQMAKIMTVEVLPK